MASARTGQFAASSATAPRAIWANIQVARFANPSGLRRRGQNQFAAGPNSGLPVVNSPGAGGSASITAGATELSNTDIGRNLVDLVLARTQFRASAQVVSTADQLFNDLANLRR